MAVGGGGGHGVRGRGGGLSRGIPNNRVTVGGGDPPELHFSWGQRSELLTLDQTYDEVFRATCDASRDILTADASPDADDDGELQGIIQFHPPNNDTDRGTIRE